MILEYKVFKVRPVLAYKVKLVYKDHKERQGLQEHLKERLAFKVFRERLAYRESKV